MGKQDCYCLSLSRDKLKRLDWNRIGSKRELNTTENIEN